MSVVGGGDATDGGAMSAEKDFSTEYAKSGKSMCRGCETNIGKVSNTMNV